MMFDAFSSMMGDQDGDFRSLWDSTEAAGDTRPLPGGEYVATIVSGKLFQASKGTPGYKLAFRVCEGEHAGSRFWHDVWLTPPALPRAKKELAKIGMTDAKQFDRPLPQGIRCRARVILRREDDGREYNRVQWFEVLGIDPPEADPFAPEAGPVTGEATA